jgi:hypothetical protein
VVAEVAVAGPGPIDSTYERFSADGLVRIGSLGPASYPDSERQEFEPRALKYHDLADHPRTYASVVYYPDGDIEVSGCHIGLPSTKPRPKATEEEKQKKAAARARRSVLQHCKFNALDKLWTLTYRGAQRSHERLYNDWEQFVSEVKKHYPEFAPLAVPEVHTGKRGGTGANLGGFHIHFAVAGFYEVNILRAIWWKIVGVKQGNVDVKWTPGKSSSRGVGRYLAKYISKSFEDSPRNSGQHRYWRCRSLTVPKERIVFFKGSFAEHERDLRILIILASGKKTISEWHSEDGGQFVLRTFQ